MSSQRIAIVAAGTGGHIYPGVAVAAALREIEPAVEVLFIGSEKGLERELVTKAGWQIKIVQRQVGLAFFQALMVLRSFRPRALLSTGGFASLPVVLAAKILGLPVFIQEQNVLPGVTNRYCAKLAKEVFLSWPESLQYLRGTVTGNPVRPEIINAQRAAAREALHINGPKKVLLIMGGSQGARRINQAVFDSLSSINGERWEIFHLIGPRDFGARELPAYPFYHPLAFLYNVGEVLAAADLVVSRAGASAIAEFTARGLPMILIPYPYAAERHQELNAAVVEKAGAALVVKNEKLTPAGFISILADAESELSSMASAASRLARPEAAKLIAERILRT